MLDLLQSAAAGISVLSIVGALLAIISVWLVGRLLVGRDLPDLVTFGAGWGLAVLAMTVLGTMGDGSLALLLPLIWGGAAVSLVREIHGRRIPSGVMALVLVLPLAVLVSGRIASEWDEFSHWLHAFRYLDSFATLPGKGRPPIESCCAAYPYGWPLLGWLSSRLFGFSEAVPGLLNLFQLALCGDLLARIMAQGEKPGWGHQAWGVLLVTVLGTTFVPKLVFTAYADVATSAMVLAGIWLVWRLTETPSWRLSLALGLCCAALVAQKPANLVLVVLVLGCGCALLLRGWALPRRGAVLGVFFAAIPVLMVWSLWRHFVAGNLAGEELLIQPFARWNLQSLGPILAGMAEVAGNKGGYFGMMAVTVVWAVIGVFRPMGDNGRLVRAVALIFCGYNGFLYFTYVAVFLREDGERVASFWRYNTHLGLLTALMVAVVLVSLRCRFAVIARAAAWSALPVILVVVAPVVGVRYIRFDLEPAKVFLRQTLQQVRSLGVRDVALIDPRGSGLSHVMASYEWNGTPKLAVYTTGFDAFTAGQYKGVADKASHVLVVSWNDPVAAAFPELTPGPHAVLSTRDGQVLARFPYPGNREPKVYP
ncbi:hypothetical protein [Magnetospirillum sulfuroxidans]|uniref:Glycosyltransferase RgtA/B/C/D-like domain-containing protein n=1 Tax=Magnetospirillum sulfuroxidans TaxID=611300 RepID=A0ABS5I7M3_9PROT|nr:hypothetical protein [Magnetospirillum sulfuroxidans]MBR9970427.1 hypothetical protein [Magnetospirillum sulfuroxidans]